MSFFPDLTTEAHDTVLLMNLIRYIQLPGVGSNQTALNHLIYVEEQLGMNIINNNDQLSEYNTMPLLLSPPQSHILLLSFHSIHCWLLVFNSLVSF